jgi:hypothetical protein
MAPTSAPDGAQKAHVPAWKRLGLKLKHAAETPEQPIATPTSTAPASSSRKRAAISTEEDQPAKKSKLIETAAPAPATPSTPVTSRLKGQKSVTFTPETKAEDGDSIKQLFSAWVAQQKADDQAYEDFCRGDYTQTFTEPAVEEFEKSTATKEIPSENRGEKETQGKRAKKPKEEKPKKVQKASKVVKPAQRLSPALDYLRQYAESRDTWKFNKNHQTYLLRNAFNTETIPADYSDLLYIYIAGLQGGVRKRLRDEALAVKVKDIDDGVAGFPNMGDAARKQQEYEAAMAEYIATATAREAPAEMGYEEGLLSGLSDVAMRPRMEKRMRAERILAELAAEDAAITTVKSAAVENDESQKRAKMNDGSAQKLGRKRKQRTAVEDDSSSSSDSDSSDTSSSGTSSSDDDSSDEENEDSESEDESTSSSSSSSSDSDSSSSSDSAESESSSDSSDSE